MYISLSKILLETGSPDDLLLEDGSSFYLLEGVEYSTTQELEYKPRKITLPRYNDPPNLLTSTLFSPPAAVVFRSSLPKFKRLRTRVIDSETAQNLLLTTLATVETPFSTLEDVQRLSKKKVIVSDIYPNLLTSTLGSLPVPATSEDSNKVISKVRKAKIEDIYPNLLTSTLAAVDTPFVAVEESLKPKKLKSVVSDISPNLLTSTLFQEIVIVPRIHQLPSRPLKREKVKINAEGTNLVLFSEQPSLPFIGIDFSRVSRRNIIQSDISPNLLTSTLFVNEVVVPRIHQLPSKPIKRPRAKVHDESPNLLTSTLASEFETRVAIVQPIPRKRKVVVSQDISSSLSLLTQPVLNPFIGRESDVIPKRKRAVQNPEPPSLLLTLFAPQPSPFVVVDFGITPPKNKVKISQDISSSLSLLTQVAPTPFIQQEQQVNRKRIVAKITEEVRNLLTSTLAQIELQSRPEFTQLLKRRKVVVNDDGVNLLTSTLSTPELLPRSEVIQQLLKRRRAVINDEVRNLLTSTLFQPEVLLPRPEMILQALRRRRAVVNIERNSTILLPVVISPGVSLTGILGLNRQLEYELSVSHINDILPVNRTISHSKDIITET